MDNVFLYVTWQFLWVYFIVYILISLCAFIAYMIRINKVKVRGAELERQLLENGELFKYARLSEQTAREEADHIKRSKSVLLSKINHEIRTPMNAVMGMASLLRETSLTEEQGTYTTTILNSSNNLLTVIKDMLLKDIIEYSKVESGTELENKDFSLRACIEEALDVFSSRAADAGLDLIYSIDDELPLQIIGDQLRLRQILLNLVDNAFRFTSQGEIYIGVHHAGSEGEGKISLEFEVRDTGAGIPPDTIRRISKDLSKPLGDSNYDSIGLTLVICKRLVYSMGGAIWVESVHTAGSVFKFTIKSRVSHQRLPPQNYHIAEIEGKEVLIVDDNFTVGDLLRKQLSNWKLKPAVATTGEKALDIISKSPGLNLVIADMNMTPMNGMQLAGRIRELYPLLPVILMRNSGDEGHLRYPAGFVSVLKKPVKQHLLANLLFSVLKQKKNGENAGNVSMKRNITTDFAKQYPLNILLAEDDNFNQLMITTALGKLGYHVEIANDGSEVLEIVSRKDYDLIFMDIEMPKMDGKEATRMIRICIAQQPIIIALTANSLQGDREECLKAGMDDYISKPVKLEELADILEKWHYAIDKKEVL